LRKTLLHRLRVAGVYHPAAKKWLILTFSLCIVIKLVSAFGVDIALEEMFCRYINTPGAVEKLLHFESWPASAETTFSIPGLVYTDTQNTPPDDSTEYPPADETPVLPDSPLPDTEADSGNDAPPDTNKPEVTVPAPHPADVYTLFEREHLDSSGIELSNHTDYEIDIDALLNEPLNISVTGDEQSPAYSTQGPIR